MDRVKLEIEIAGVDLTEGQTSYRKLKIIIIIPVNYSDNSS